MSSKEKQMLKFVRTLDGEIQIDRYISESRTVLEEDSEGNQIKVKELHPLNGKPVDERIFHPTLQWDADNPEECLIVANFLFGAIELILMQKVNHTTREDYLDITAGSEIIITAEDVQPRESKPKVARKTKQEQKKIDFTDQLLEIEAKVIAGEMSREQAHMAQTTLLEELQS